MTWDNDHAKSTCYQRLSEVFCKCHDGSVFATCWLRTRDLSLNPPTHCIPPSPLGKKQSSDLSLSPPPQVREQRWSEVLAGLFLGRRRCSWSASFPPLVSLFPSRRPSAPVYIPPLCCDTCYIKICVTRSFNIQRGLHLLSFLDHPVGPCVPGASLSVHCWLLRPSRWRRAKCLQPLCFAINAKTDENWMILDFRCRT